MNNEWRPNDYREVRSRPDTTMILVSPTHPDGKSDASENHVVCFCGEPEAEQANPNEPLVPSLLIVDIQCC